jgi:hypothetical protein
MFPVVCGDRLPNEIPGYLVLAVCGVGHDRDLAAVEETFSDTAMPLCLSQCLVPACRVPKLL